MNKDSIGRDRKRKYSRKPAEIEIEGYNEKPVAFLFGDSNVDFTPRSCAISSLVVCLIVPAHPAHPAQA